MNKNKLEIQYRFCKTNILILRHSDTNAQTN